jgi:hypothetical protein
MLTTFVGMSTISMVKIPTILSLYRFLPTNVVMSPTFGFECMMVLFESEEIWKWSEHKAGLSLLRYQTLLLLFCDCEIFNSTTSASASEFNKIWPTQFFAVLSRLFQNHCTKYQCFQLF